MDTVHYSRPKLALAAAPLALLFWFFLRIWLEDESASIALLIVSLLFAYLLATVMFAIMRSDPVLAFDDQRLKVKKLLREADIDWRQVQDISIDTYRLRHNFLPVWSQRFLKIRTNDDTYRFALLTLALPSGGGEGLVRLLAATKVCALARGSSPARNLQRDGWGRPGTADVDHGGPDGFDRHLAARQQAHTQTPAAPRGFGRKGA